MASEQTYHLAELNVGRLLAPVEDPRVAEFIWTVSTAWANGCPGLCG